MLPGAQPPFPCLPCRCSLGLRRVCAGGSEGSLKEQVCLCLLAYLRLRQPSLISVNTVSTPHLFGVSDAMPHHEATGA